MFDILLYIDTLRKKNEKKVTFKVIDSDSFLTYIWRGIYKHKTNNILSRI